MKSNNVAIFDRSASLVIFTTEDLRQDQITHVPEESRACQASQPSTPYPLWEGVLRRPPAPSPSEITPKTTASQKPPRNPEGLHVQLPLLSPCGTP